MKSIKKLSVSLLFVCTCFGSQSAHAGIPVIDAANLAQAIQQIVAWGKQYQQMVDQIKQAEQQYKSVTGTRNLGDILNNPMLKQAVPADVAQVLNAINSGGSAGLTGAAQAIRNGSMKYNCEDRSGDGKTTCEAILNGNAQNQAYLQNALQIATLRVQQIQSLQSQINGTDDPKAIAELQARIAAENAQVTNDANRIAVMQSLAQAQQLAAEQADRERWLNLMKPDTPTAVATFTYTVPQ